MSNDTVIAEAEAVLAAAATDLFGVREDECLLCYVRRMLEANGCTGLRWAVRYRDLRAPRATALERRLEQKGGFCDCEIFMNGYRLADPFLVPARTIRTESGARIVVEDERCPEPFPDCFGVRRGSTQPCRLWCRQGRWW